MRTKIEFHFFDIYFYILQYIRFKYNILMEESIYYHNLFFLKYKSKYKTILLK
jgi:hypothetical protein